MVKTYFQPAITALLVMGASAGFLHYRGPHQKLGPCGIRLQHDALLAENAQLRTNGVVLPERLIGYTSMPLPIHPDELKYLPVDTTYGRRLYHDDIHDFYALISIVVMGTDRSSLHRPELCLGSSGFNITHRKAEPVETSFGPVEFLRCDGNLPSNATQGLDRAVFAYMFLSADRQTSSHSQRHFQSMRDMVVSGVMPRWAGIQCFARCREGEESATFTRMKGLLTQILPKMRHPDLLPKDHPEVHAGSPNAAAPSHAK